jgi:hypothetical protein
MKRCCDIRLPFKRKRQQSFATYSSWEEKTAVYAAKPVVFATLGSPDFDCRFRALSLQDAASKRRRHREFPARRGMLRPRGQASAGKLTALLFLLLRLAPPPNGEMSRSRTATGPRFFRRNEDPGIANSHKRSQRNTGRSVPSTPRYVLHIRTR